MRSSSPARHPKCSTAGASSHQRRALRVAVEISAETRHNGAKTVKKVSFPTGPTEKRRKT